MTPKSSALRAVSRGGFKFREAVPARPILTQIPPPRIAARRPRRHEPSELGPERPPKNRVDPVDKQEYVKRATRAAQVEPDPKPAMARAPAEHEILELELWHGDSARAQAEPRRAPRPERDRVREHGERRRGFQRPRRTE